MKLTKNSTSFRNKVKVGIGLVIALAALAAIVVLVVPHEVQKSQANPKEHRLDKSPVAVAKNSGREVAGIDWDYWLSVNSNIVGWITIPDTPVDYPIVQAPANDPTHYLNYDVYENYNIYGSVYVDSSCTLESSNVVLFGHNMGTSDNTMFSTLTDYLDPDYLAEHEQVIIQTPRGVLCLKVRAAQTVNPSGYEMHTMFGSTQELHEYYMKTWEEADARCADPHPEEINQLFTLITCAEDGTIRALVTVG